MNCFERLEKNRKTLKYIITGTGRCGTGTISKALSGAGISCGHENIFTVVENYPCKQYVAECSFLAIPYLEYLNNDVKIIHLIRDPVKTIKSISYCDWFSKNRIGTDLFTNFMHRHLPILDIYKDCFSKIMCWYIYWNKKIERMKPNFVCRLEFDTKELFKYIGIETEVKVEKNFNTAINRNKNFKEAYKSDEKIKLQIKKHSLYPELQEFIERYNYNV